MEAFALSLEQPPAKSPTALSAEARNHKDDGPGSGRYPGL